MSAQLGRKANALETREGGERGTKGSRRKKAYYFSDATKDFKNTEK